MQNVPFIQLLAIQILAAVHSKVIKQNQLLIEYLMLRKLYEFLKVNKN